MLSFLFTVTMLTVLFSVTAGLALLIRKGIFKGKESGMYYVWLAVLILALVPVKIGEPKVLLFPQESQQVPNNTMRNNTAKLSELIKYSQLPKIDFDISGINAGTNPGTKEIPGVTDMTAKPENSIDILKLISENKDKAIAVLLIIWFAGFIFVLVKTIGSYVKMKKFFYKESGECADEKTNSIFNECFESVGLKRQINLRIMKWNFASPCVCGLFRPTIFIDGDCVSLSAKKLKYILIHELYHIKRYDMLYKVLSVIVAGVHWFNPLMYKVIKTIDEDCELSVDRYVMSVFGNEQSDYYMNIILDIAERKCAVQNRPLVNMPYTSLFFGEKRNINFLKRRYDNMKNIINKKHLIITLAVFLAVMIPMNTIIMSSCGITGTPASAQQPVNNVSTVYYDANVYEAALRMYFGLLPGEEITQEQLAEITEISIIKGIKTDGTMVENINNVALGSLTPVSFVINGREFNMVPSIVHKKFFEEYILEKFIETYSENERNIHKLNAYYAIKDPNAPEIDPRAREEMFIDYPITRDFPIAAFDPNASIREYQEILSYFAAAGLLDDNFVQNNTIDATYLTKLPNLHYISLVNIEFQNSELLPDDGTIVISRVSSAPAYIEPAESYTAVTQNSSSQSLSGVYEHPNYGINLTENHWELPDGTEYLEFKNLSLRNALTEYFAQTEEYFDFNSSNPVTLDMLSKITSISVRRIPEYDYVFDIPENVPKTEYPLKGMYLEYTINGKKLDIVPDFIRIDMYQIFEHGLFGSPSHDILYYCDEAIFNEYGLLYYAPKASLTEADKLEMLEIITKNYGLPRMALYQDENGEYFTINRPDLAGFTTRYYDQTEYDATDMVIVDNRIDKGKIV